MKSNGITINRKVTLSLLAVLLTFLLLEYIIFYKIVLPGFASLQCENACENAERCQYTIVSELSHIKTLAYDWSAWNDTYNFTKDNDDKYIQTNLSDNVFTSGTFDLMFITNLEGKVIFGKVYDPQKEQTISIKEFPQDGFGPDHWLIKHSSPENKITGLLPTENGLMMIASLPVINSEGQGPIRGTLIMGRFLNSSKIKQFSEQVDVNFSISPENTSFDEPYNVVKWENTEHLVFARKDGKIKVVQQLDCLDGSKAMLVSFTPDNIIQKGHSIAKLSLLFGLGISSIFLISVFINLKYSLITKIGKICDFVKRISETGDLSRRLEVGGKSELNTLSKIINNMLDTMEANEEQITRARIGAEAANEAKSHFLANMSHEIRTPMNAIIGFSDLMAEENITDEQKEYVEAIRSSGNNLLNLINDILDFSKIEAGKLNIELKEYPIDQILASVESQMHSLAKTKGLDFQINLGNELPSIIHTDIYRLQQCLVNLIGNAVKFTEKGHVFVNVSHEDWGGQSFIRFDVEDTGIGISREKRNAIFESFTQEDYSSTRIYGGTGLGLAITKQLVELLGGDLTLTSEQGKGSVFSLAIPVGLTPANRLFHEIAEKTKSQEKEKNNENYQAKYTGTILVAEDVKTNQVLIELILKKMGFDITIVENGRQAVEKFCSEKFDLIFMDIHMPDMNGYEATKAIRKEDKNIPIIALTANVMAGDRQKCINAGCTDYLSKPIDNNKLAEIIAKYIPARQTNSN